MKLQIDQTLVSYHEIGEGRPLLAIHGWLTDHQYIMKILEPAFEKRQGLSRVLIGDWLDRVEAHATSASQ